MYSRTAMKIPSVAIIAGNVRRNITPQAIPTATANSRGGDRQQTLEVVQLTEALVADLVHDPSQK